MQSFYLRSIHYRPHFFCWCVELAISNLQYKNDTRYLSRRPVSFFVVQYERLAIVGCLLLAECWSSDCLWVGLFMFTFTLYDKLFLSKKVGSFISEGRPKVSSWFSSFLQGLFLLSKRLANIVYGRILLNCSIDDVRHVSFAKRQQINYII